jgi:hypothetical protein
MSIFTFTSQVRQNSPLFLLTVFENGDDHLPVQLKIWVETHSASSALNILSLVVHKFVNNITITKSIGKCFKILFSYVNIST